MTYTEFKNALFIAIADAADAHPRGQVDVFEVADSMMLDVQDQWVSDAVTSYEAADLVFNVVRPLGDRRDGAGGIALMIKGRGREKADELRAGLPKKPVIELGQADKVRIVSEKKGK